MTTRQSSRQARGDWPSAVLYRLTSPSDAVYIGQTRNLRGRLANYRSMARGKGSAHKQPLLLRSLLKYGFDAHKIDILHRMPYDISQADLDNYERYAIQMHKNMRGTRLLNTSNGGRGVVPHSSVRALSRPELRGEKHPLSKLSEADVVAIRKTYRWGSSEFSLNALAGKYGVSQRLIHNVVKGKAWEHVKGGCPEATNAMSKLSLSDASKIRERYAKGGCTHRSLAAEYGTNHQTIGQIIRNPNWGRFHAAPIFEASDARLT